jgi:hypothetical protein
MTITTNYQNQKIIFRLQLCYILERIIIVRRFIIPHGNSIERCNHSVTLALYPSASKKVKMSISITIKVVHSWVIMTTEMKSRAVIRRKYLIRPKHCSHGNSSKNCHLININVDDSSPVPLSLVDLGLNISIVSFVGIVVQGEKVGSPTSYFEQSWWNSESWKWRLLVGRGVDVLLL